MAEPKTKRETLKSAKRFWKTQEQIKVITVIQEERDRTLRGIIDGPRLLSIGLQKKEGCSLIWREPKKTKGTSLNERGSAVKSGGSQNGNRHKSRKTGGRGESLLDFKGEKVEGKHLNAKEGGGKAKARNRPGSKSSKSSITSLNGSNGMREKTTRGKKRKERSRS